MRLALINKYIISFAINESANDCLNLLNFMQSFD